MKRSALSLALLIAAFASTTELAHARPISMPSPVLLVADESCGVGYTSGAASPASGTPDWCPSPYSGPSDWLAAREIAVSVSGDGLSVVTSSVSGDGESGMLATEPQSAGRLPQPVVVAPLPSAADAVEPIATPEAPTLPTVVATATPPPAPPATPAPPRQPIPSGLTPPYPGVLYLYYDVNGSSYNEVQEQASKNGPTDGHGEHWAGTTNWSMTWKAKAMPDGRLTDVEVGYTAKATLPRWMPPAGVDDADIQQWTVYVDKLVKHENHHIEILVSHIPEVTNALRNANRGNVQAVFDAEFKRISQLQDDYDAVTNHGLN